MAQTVTIEVNIEDLQGKLDEVFEDIFKNNKKKINDLLRKLEDLGNKTLGDLSGAILDGSFNLGDIIKEAQESLQNIFKETISEMLNGTLTGLQDSFKDIVSGIVKSISDKLQETILTPFLDTFSDVFSGITEFLSEKILNPLLGSIGNALFGGSDGGGLLSGISDFFGGFFANGGIPPVGRPSIIGENGPELFVPRVGGRIIPNNQLAVAGGGLSVNFSQVINVSPGLEETVQAKILEAAPAIAAQAKSGVFQAIERGGRESAAVGRRLR